MTEAGRNTSVNDKLACEHEKFLARPEKLLDATRKVLAQKDLMGLLQTEADCARELIGAKYAATGHGYINGVFTAGGVSLSEEAMDCPTGEIFKIEKGGVYLDLIKEKDSFRLTDAEMRSNPAWWGLPESHVPLRGLLGARLVDVNGQPNGLLMVSDKEDGSDFTTEDENILSQLAAIASLALQHILARLEAENEKRRLEALMNALPVGVSFSDDPTCQSITGNPEVLAQFDVTPEDNLSASAPNSNAPGKQVRYFMDGQQITDAALPLQRAVAENREIPPVELDIELPSGRRWFTEASGAPIRDAQGNAIGGVAVTVDITDRKRAEDALAESEAKYWMLFNSIDEGFCIIEVLFDDKDRPLDYRFIEVNHAFERQTGLVDAAGHCMRDMAPDHERHWFDIYGRIALTGEPARFQNAAGALGRFYDVYAFRVGKPEQRRVAILFNDISERRRAEEALKEHEARRNIAEAIEAERQRFFGVLETLPVMISLLTPDYHVAFANRAFREKFGESNGRHCYEYCSGYTEPCNFCESFKVLQTGKPHNWEFTGQHGSLIDAYGFPFTDVDGSPMILVMGIDITERRRTETELIEAKERAETAVGAKAAFLANMSHEIRTPMNSVIGFTELLLDDSDDPLSPEQKDSLETIRTNGEALLTIINDILDFSKMESDKVVLDDQPFTLRQCVKDSVDLVSIKASEKGLNLSYAIDKRVPDTIIGDLGRLRQVLGNLLSNAVKFTDEGEVKISVSSQQIDGTSEVHFAVQDTGIGIPQGSMHQLFQPFNQMEPSTTRLYGGTGLGLAISKKLVELMDGRIWAESEVGNGSTFHFTIRAPSGQVEPEPAGVSPHLVGKHALIIEDNKTNCLILSKQVYDWGMVPITAKSGQEAFRLILMGDDFDIAILDMDLQDMDALELEEKIHKYRKTLPLLFLTSLGKRAPSDHAYLTKPIQPSLLHKVLTDILPNTDILHRADALPKEPSKGLAMASGVDRPIHNSSLRILLAEDNISSQKVAQQMLKKLGYRADTVANGIEALHALERQHYDVVLMDVKMPEMDGIEATSLIRQRWPDGPKIIAITAYALKGDREKFIEAGMDDYIAKPMGINDLRAVIERNSPGKNITERLR